MDVKDEISDEEINQQEEPTGGTITSSVVELKTLGTLNISNNGLTGDIPLCFSKLVMLEQLDVSHNRLIGTLASLAGLHVLIDLNISYSLFMVQIPATLLKFLNSSFYSFSGNPILCVDCVLNNYDAARDLRRYACPSAKHERFRFC